MYVTYMSYSTYRERLPLRFPTNQRCLLQYKSSDAEQHHVWASVYIEAYCWEQNRQASRS